MDRQFCVTGHIENYYQGETLIRKLDGRREARGMESTAIALTGTPAKHLSQYDHNSKPRLQRQSSDNGPESGIGSDSDSGTSTVYFENYGEPFYPPAVQICVAPAFIHTGPTVAGGHQALQPLNSYQTELRNTCYEGINDGMDWMESPRSGTRKDPQGYGEFVGSGFDDYSATRINDVTMKQSPDEKFESRHLQMMTNSIIKDRNDKFMLTSTPRLEQHQMKTNSNPTLMEGPRLIGSYSARKQLFSESSTRNESSPIYNRSISDNQAYHQRGMADRNYHQDQRQFVSISKLLAENKNGYNREKESFVSSSDTHIASTPMSADEWKYEGRRIRRASDMTEELNNQNKHVPGSQQSYSSLPWGKGKQDTRLKIAEMYSGSTDGGLESEYSPEKIRRQCESLQMKLSQDFPAPPVGYSTVAAETEALKEAWGKKSQQRRDYGQPMISHSPRGGIDRSNYAPSTARQLSTSSLTSQISSQTDLIGVRTPVRQLSPDAGVPHNQAFQDDQPATLPRPGRMEIKNKKYEIANTEYECSTEPRNKTTHPPTRRWTIMDKTPKVMRTVMTSASKLVTKVKAPSRQTSTPAGLDGSMGSQDITPSVSHQRQNSVPTDIHHVDRSPVNKFSIFSNRNKNSSSSSINSETTSEIEKVFIVQKENGVKAKQEVLPQKQSPPPSKTEVPNNTKMINPVESSRLSHRDEPIIKTTGATSVQTPPVKTERKPSNSIASTFRSRITSPFRKQPQQSKTENNVSPGKPSKTYRIRGSSVDGNNNNGSISAFSIAAPYLYGNGSELDRKNHTNQNNISPTVKSTKFTDKQNFQLLKSKDISISTPSTVHKPVISGQTGQRTYVKPQQPNISPTFETLRRKAGLLPAGLHPDLPRRARVDSTGTRDSSPGSTTGRTRKEFRTFHGDITPMTWSDEDSYVLASPREQSYREICVDIPFEDHQKINQDQISPAVEDMEVSVDGAEFMEKLTIKSDTEEVEIPKINSALSNNNSDIKLNSKDISAQSIKNPDLKINSEDNSVTSNVSITPQHKPPERLRSLKTRRQRADDELPAKRHHPNKTRSASCSAGDTRINLASREDSSSMFNDPQQVYTLLGRQTSDNLTADEQDFLEQITVVGRHEYAGMTSGRQAVNDIDILLDIAQCLLEQPASQGICFERTITAEEFNLARDELSGISKKFVTDCKTLVSSAGQNRALLVMNINGSMKTFIQIIARCRVMLLCLSAPDDKKGLVGIVTDVGEGYKKTIASASRAVGNFTNPQHVGQLMNEVQALTLALGRIVQTLSKLEYVKLVRRF